MWKFTRYIASPLALVTPPFPYLLSPASTHFSNLTSLFELKSPRHQLPALKFVAVRLRVSLHPPHQHFGDISLLPRIFILTDNPSFLAPVRAWMGDRCLARGDLPLSMKLFLAEQLSSFQSPSPLERSCPIAVLFRPISYVELLLFPPVIISFSSKIISLYRLGSSFPAPGGIDR